MKQLMTILLILTLAVDGSGDWGGGKSAGGSTWGGGKSAEGAGTWGGGKSAGGSNWQEGKSANGGNEWGDGKFADGAGTWGNGGGKSAHGGDVSELVRSRQPAGCKLPENCRIWTALHI